MKYVGVALYVFWLLLTMFKFESMPKDRNLSYRDVFFGNIVWYHNLRTLLFAAAVVITVIYAPLKIIYLLILISCIILGIVCLRNFFNLAGNPWIDLGFLMGAVICGILSGLFIFKM